MERFFIIRHKQTGEAMLMNDGQEYLGFESEKMAEQFMQAYGWPP